MKYLKWCNVLNIEPKEEKLRKPFACELHFHHSDIIDGLLKPDAVPKIHPRTKLTKIRRKYKKSYKSKVVSKTTKIVVESPLNIKKEEISIEEPQFADGLPIFFEVEKAALKIELDTEQDKEFLDSLLPDMKRMNARQKSVFKLLFSRLKS